MNKMTYKEVPPNHMKWWTREEDEKLWETFFNTRYVFHDNKHNREQIRYWSPKQLGEMFGRSSGAVLRRLNDIGAIVYQVNGYYVQGTNSRYADVGTCIHRGAYYPYRRD